MKSKIKSIKQLAEISRNLATKGLKVGLVTGCFDILHAGHIDLITFAKKNCDILIVGLDSDTTISQTKGSKRPLVKIKERLKVMASLENVDFVFEITGTYKHGSKQSEKNHENLIAKLKPYCLITNANSDNHYKRKVIRGEKLGVLVIVDFNGTKLNSSTNIINKFLEMGI